MAKVKEDKFEDALGRLEEIVQNLEDGELNLDEALKLYEEGIGISQTCTKRLEEAQKKVEVLVRNSSGKLSTKEVDSETLNTKKSKKK